jgi:hypothetical protein
MAIILSKTTKTGVTYKVMLVDSLGSDPVNLQVEYPGQPLDQGCRLELIRVDGSIDHPILRKLPAGRYDVIMSRKGQYVLTWEEGDVVRAAIAARLAEIDGSPEGLLEDRREITDRLAIAVAEDQGRRERAWEAEKVNAAVATKTGRVESIERQLAEFDAAHPEVLALIQAKRSDRARLALNLAD